MDHDHVMKTAAHIPNLFDRSRFGGKVTFVDSADDVDAESFNLLIVDLDRCEDITAFRVAGVRVIGFGPHVDSRLHNHAVEVGFDEVMPRSVFFRRLPELLDPNAAVDRGIGVVGTGTDRAVGSNVE